MISDRLRKMSMDRVEIAERIMGSRLQDHGYFLGLRSWKSVVQLQNLMVELKLFILLLLVLHHISINCGVVGPSTILVSSGRSSLFFILVVVIIIIVHLLLLGQHFVKIFVLFIILAHFAFIIISRSRCSFLFIFVVIFNEANGIVGILGQLAIYGFLVLCNNIMIILT